MFIPIWLIILAFLIWLISGIRDSKRMTQYEAKISEWITKHDEQKRFKEIYCESLNKERQRKTENGYCTFCWKCSQEKR